MPNILNSYIILLKFTCKTTGMLSDNKVLKSGI